MLKFHLQGQPLIGLAGVLLRRESDYHGSSTVNAICSLSGTVSLQCKGQLYVTINKVLYVVMHGSKLSCLYCGPGMMTDLSMIYTSRFKEDTESLYHL